YRPRPDDEPGARPAAVALILTEGPDGAEALFIHRADRPGDPWSGHVAFPGGRREPGDADLLATAMRETREEVGVDLAAAERLGVLSDMRPRTPVLPAVYVRPFVFALSARPSLTLSDEVQGVFWVPLRRLLEPGVQRDVTIAVRGAEHTLPAYVLGDWIIWGMTERILTPFLELVSRATD
ncbi:MAG: NUDIX hydrolase, partial [Candidatus Rokuibacteriota bacterium]